MKKYKVSLILNIIIFCLVTIGTVFMMTGTRFMGEDFVLTKTKIETLKFFTVDSNILMGIVAAVFAYFDYLIISKKRKEIPNFVYLLKHVATVGVVLTFIVTVFYLAPFSEYSFFTFFKNSNLFFHFMVPVLSVITYLLYENKNQNKKVVIYGLVPMIIYAIFYIINYLINNSSSAERETYDWYGLMSNNVIGNIISISSMVLLTYLISLELWHLNKNMYSRK